MRRYLDPMPNPDRWIHTGRTRPQRERDLIRCAVCTERVTRDDLKLRRRGGHFVEVCVDCRDEWECPGCGDNVCDDSRDRFDDPVDDYRWVCEECAYERGREK